LPFRQIITDAAQVTQLVEQTIEQFGRVDVLVNNAGVGSLKPFFKESAEYINQALDVNLRGAMLATHAVLPGMLERRHGAIISVASVAGHVAISPLYSSTKFGLRGFSFSAAPGAIPPWYCGLTGLAWLYQNGPEQGITDTHARTRARGQENCRPWRSNLAAKLSYLATTVLS